jgi:hypothetical protein
MGKWVVISSEEGVYGKQCVCPLKVLRVFRLALDAYLHYGYVQ